MDWNANRKTVTLPPMYPKNQPSFLEPNIINTSSQVPLNPPRSNHPACMFPSNSNPVPQSALNIRNTVPQQISASDIHSRTIFPSQASVERNTYANVKGPNQLNNSLQMSPGVAQNVWTNSSVSNSMFSQTGAAVTQPNSFRINLPNVNALQNQFVSSEIYPRQGQMVPSNSVRVPVTYQGNQRLTSSLSERQADWPQQYTSNGLSYADYRPHSEQYNYPSQCFLQSPALQKQNPMPLTSVQVKNSHPSNSALTLQSKQTAPLPSYQMAVLQTEKKLPTPYDCRYVSQTFQNSQHVITHSSSDVPQSQEAHISEIRKDFCRGFQQQNLNENESMIGNFCNVKVNTNNSQPYNDPTRSVDGVQILPQSNQEERVEFCNSSSSQVPDTSLTKEKLVKDIEKLVEMRNKFYELARKVKIDKNILLSSGCIKANSESTQNSELALKQTGKIQFGPQVSPATPEIVEDKSPTAVEIEKTNRMHSTLNSNIQDTNLRNSHQVNSMLLNSVCSGKGPVSDQLHNLKDGTFKTPAMEQTQFSSGNVVNVEGNERTNAKTVSVPQSMAFESYASKYLNENRLLINLLTHGDDSEKRLMKDGCETFQDSKPHSSEKNVNTQVTDNQLNLKTMETPSCYNINAKISGNSFCLDHKSSPTGVTLNSDSHSLELIATCLNLWRKPSKPTEKKQCIELNTQQTAVGLSKAGEICNKAPISLVGNSQNKMENCSQVTTLPMVVQNYESASTTTTKGTELQIAVVSPLIADIKTFSLKGISPDSLPETVYPVIKEGSVCSLQNQWAENPGVTAVLKENEPVTSIMKTTKVFPLIPKEKQNASINDKSEGPPPTNQGTSLESEPGTHCTMSDQQASSNQRDGDTVSSELLQIDNICSLVEGDTSYNYQIAKIFNPPPIEKIEPQKLLPNLQVTSKKQAEKLDNMTEKIEPGLQEDNFLRHTEDLYKIPDKSKSTQLPEPSFLKHVDFSENLEESNLKHTKQVSTSKDTCSSDALHQDCKPQEIDVSCNHTAQDPTVNEILDNTSIFPHNQLSELLKEFPYGIEPVNTHEDSPAQQIRVPNSKDESCHKTSCEYKDATDQIKITILSSEQMKELFPEQNESPEVDKSTHCEKENPVTKNIQCDSPVHTDASNFEIGSENDDIRCCALGWLSNAYKGISQCQCNSIKNLTSNVENGKDQCSLQTNICKQGENISDKDDSIVYKTSPNNNPKISLTFPIGEKRSETEQGRGMKDLSKPLFSSLRTDQELMGQTLSKVVKKLDSLKCHTQKGKLKFHEVTFYSSEKRKFSEESSQRKIIGQNSSPPKGKPIICANKNKDLSIKKSSLREFLPEERKLETGGSQQKVSVKRKLGEGSILNSEMKKMKYFKQDQNKNEGVTLKTGILLNPNEGAKSKEKEKTVSDVKSSGSPSKDGLPKAVITIEQYWQRQKYKEAIGIKASKLNCEKSIPCETQSMRSNKLSVQVGSCGKSNELHSSNLQTSEDSLSICSSQTKKTKIHHSNVSKSYLLGNVKETVGGKQPEKMFMDKTKLDKNSTNISNGVEPSHLSPQAREQRKQYLNRVAFKCIERESICLTKLESLPKNVNKEKRVENKPNSPFPKKTTTEKQSMLEFKLCPDGLINKTNSTKEQKDLQPCPRKEQAPMQVTGIKSSKEDWIKGKPEEKRIPEVNQEIGVCNSEPLLVRFRRLDSNPRGSLLYAMDGNVLEKAAGTKRGPDELSPASASTANGNDRKKFKGDNNKLKVKVESKKLELKADSKKLKVDRQKLKLKGDGEKLKLKVDNSKSNGDKKFKIDSEPLKLKLDCKKLNLKGDGSKLKIDKEKLKGVASKFKIDNEKLKLCKELQLKGDDSKLKGDGSKLKGDSKMKGNSKKFKGDNRNSGVPSRVIYIGKLPGDVTEDEVIFLGLPFGKVTNLLMMKWKNQAFIEMNTEEAAITMVNYYTSMTPMIRGQPIYIQFSYRKELYASSSHKQAQVHSALQALNSVQSRKLALASLAGDVGSGTVDAGPLGTVNAAIGHAVDSGAVNAVDVGAGTVSSGSLGKGAVCSGTENVSPVGAAAADADMEMTSQSQVLRIVIENLSHPLSLDMLHQVFSHFGKVLKIITFTQNNTFQALLQYAEPLSAELAKMFLDSCNIFGCSVRFSLSTSSILNVKYNNSKSRVYTYPDLPWCDSQASQDQAVTSAFSVSPVMTAPLKPGAGFHSTLSIPQAAGHCYPNEIQALPPVAIVSVSGAAAEAEAEGHIVIPDPVSVAIPTVSEPEAEAGQIAIPSLAPGNTPLVSEPEAAASQIAIPGVAAAAAAAGQIAIPSLAPVAIPLVSEAAAAGLIAIPGPAPAAIPGVAAAGPIAIPGPPPLVSEAAAAAAAGSLIASSSPAEAGNCVLLVRNLNPKRIKIQSLFIIFGVYGNVQRAKIFFKNKTRALVQMADGTQAQLAMRHLNGQKLYGQPMLITVTLHKDVHLLRKGQADLDLTKDYSNSHLHRFQKSCSKNAQKVFPPSEYLFLSHIPRFTPLHHLTALFSSNGRIVKRIKFFRKHRDIVLIKMGSVEQAIDALIDLHYHKLGKHQHLWVTFSKIPPHSRKQPF